MNLNIQNLQLGMHQESIRKCGGFGVLFADVLQVPIVPASPDSAAGTISPFFYFSFI